MFAIIRRYDGVDQNRSAELTRNVNETLVPKLEKLSGFAGYWLIEAGNGVFSSLSLYETPEQAQESTMIVADWIRDEKLDTALPNEPKITSGKVVAHSNRVWSPRNSTAPHWDERGGPACRPPSRLRRVDRAAREQHVRGRVEQQDNWVRQRVANVVRSGGCESVTPSGLGCVALHQLLERGLVADRVEVAVLRQQANGTVRCGRSRAGDA